MANPGDFAYTVKQQADIVRVVGEYVRLKKNGQNFTGLCPFHSEKTPSFAVHPVKQIYHCFGCGKHGTVLGFLMDHDHMAFPEAVEELAPFGEHPLGRACDFMLSTGGVMPAASWIQKGYDIAAWAQANASRLGIMYIIYRQRIWDVRMASSGWVPMENRGGITANHYDHVHISVF